MLRTLKRFASNIHFWWNEMKLRSEENAKLSALQDSEET